MKKLLKRIFDFFYKEFETVEFVRREVTYPLRQDDYIHITGPNYKAQGGSRWFLVTGTIVRRYRKVLNRNSVFKSKKQHLTLFVWDHCMVSKGDSGKSNEIVTRIRYNSSDSYQFPQYLMLGYSNEQRNKVENLTEVFRAED